MSWTWQNSPPSLELARRIDAVCNRFEAAWRSGAPPHIRDFLDGWSGAERSALLRELVLLDLDYRRDTGLACRVEDYLAPFPDIDPTWLADALVGTSSSTGMSATRVGQPSADASQARRVGCVGDFDLGEQVGWGGMGIVYRARDLGLDRDLAVKVLRPEHQGRPELVRRFLAEACIVARLQHPCIPPVHGRGQLPDGRPFFTMKLIRGETLVELLRRRRHPAEELPRFVGIFAQVCQAVAYAHSQGILHRDLKPHNVMVGAFGEVQLLDWGLAKDLQPGGQEWAAEQSPIVGNGVARAAVGAADTDTVDLAAAEEDDAARPLETQFGQAVGTLAYMPPEQARGEVSHVDERSDAFGLGAILCEVLTGRSPFSGGDSRQIYHKVRAGDHGEALARLDRCGADAELVRLARSCLAIDLADRPRDAGEVAAQVKAYLEGVQESLQAAERQRAAAEARAAEARRTVAAERRARRWMVWAALGVLSVSTAGLATTYWQYRKADAQKQQAEEANQQYRDTLYAATIHLARQAWLDGQIAHCLELLDGEGCRPTRAGQTDLRGWEWYYLRSLCHKAARSWPADSLPLSCIAFSPDGSRLAVGVLAKVHILDVGSGQKLDTLTGHTAEIRGLAYSPDGRLLAAADSKGILEIWDAVTGQEVRSTASLGAMYSLAFSPDSRRLAIGTGNGRIWLYDPRAGRLLRSLVGHTSQVRGLAFSPDNQWLASASEDRTVRLWPLAASKPVRVLREHIDKVNSVAFSPDGRQLATTSEDYSVRLWDLQLDKVIHVLQGHTAYVWDAVFSPDGRWLASAGDDRIVRLWEVASGKESRAFRGHKDWVRCVRFSPDGRWLVSAGLEEAKFWDRAEPLQEAYRLCGHSMPVTCLASAPKTSRLLASGSRDGTVVVWETQRREAPRIAQVGHGGEVWGVAFHPDGRQLASAGMNGLVKLWDAMSGKLLHTLSGHSAGLRTVAFSCDGRLLASAGIDRTIKVWDVATGKEVRTLEGHSDEVRSIAFSPDGRLLASAGNDRNVMLWDIDKGQVLSTLRGHEQAVASVAFHPGGEQLASAGYDGTIRLWDVAGGQPLLTLRGHTGRVFGLAFGPNDRLASSGDDQTVRVWNCRSGHELLILKGHTALIYQVALSPDGRWLASAAADGAVLVRHACCAAPATDPLAAASAPAQLLSWHSGEAIACLKAKQEAAARFHLDRLNAVVLARNDFPADESERQALAVQCASLGSVLEQQDKPAEALAPYRKAVELCPDNHSIWYSYVPLCLYQGDKAAYHRCRREMLTRFGDTRDPVIAERTAKACLLLPVAGEELQQASALADRALALGSSHHFLPYFQLCKGLAEYRQGRLDSAVGWLQKARSAPGGHWNLTVPAHLVLALAQHRRGDVSSARKSLAAARRISEEQHLAAVKGYAAWMDEILRREAEAEIEGTQQVP